MAFKTLQDLDCETTTALGGRDKKTGKAHPTQVEGYFIGTKEVPSKKTKTGFSSLHIIQTENGNLGVWGKTDLDRKLKAVAAGNMVRLSFTGMKQTDNGEMYKFKVEVDETNTIEVNLSKPASEAAAVDESEEFEDENSVDDDVVLPDEIPYTPPTRPARAAVTPSAENQAKVQALLAGNRAKR